TRFSRDWSSDVCSSDLEPGARPRRAAPAAAPRDGGGALSLAIGKCSTAANTRGRTANVATGRTKCGLWAAAQSAQVHPVRGSVRSEERRVGKESRHAAV